MHGTTQQAMQVFVVQLDNVERGGDAAIRLGNDKHRGSRHLLRLDFGGFGFLPAHVKRILLYVTHHKVLVFHGTDAVHEILIHCFLILKVNTMPATHPVIKAASAILTGLKRRSNSVSTVNESSCVSLRIRVSSSS